MFVWLAASAIFVSCRPKQFACTRDGSSGRTLTQRKATYAADVRSNLAYDPSIYSGYTGTVDTPRSSDDPTFTFVTLAMSGLAAIVLGAAISTTMTMLQAARPVAVSYSSTMIRGAESAVSLERGAKSAVSVDAAAAYMSPAPEPVYLAPEAPAVPVVAPVAAAPTVKEAPILAAVAEEHAQVSAVAQVPAVAMAADTETSETKVKSSAGTNPFSEGSAFKALRARA